MRAWLEKKDGGVIEIAGHCYIGRAPGNELRIDSSKVSRRHAFIHAQQSGAGQEFWIADLGSTNGTIRNGKRVTLPSRLTNGDLITIGDEALVFRMDAHSTTGGPLEEAIAATVHVRMNQLCWLLMVDIKRFTTLSQQLEPDALGRIVGTWLRQCRDAIESSGGVVDKLLGDAIFAYWPDSPQASGQIGAALLQLGRVQQTRDPDFRIIVHHGRVMMEGGAGGANNLSGPGVIFVFRMEKVCAALELDSLMSEPAAQALAEILPSSPVGRHPLDGFPGAHAMYQVSGDVTQRSL